MVILITQDVIAALLDVRGVRILEVLRVSIHTASGILAVPQGVPDEAESRVRIGGLNRWREEARIRSRVLSREDMPTPLPIVGIPETLKVDQRLRLVGLKLGWSNRTLDALLVLLELEQGRLLKILLLITLLIRRVRMALPVLVRLLGPERLLLMA